MAVQGVRKFGKDFSAIADVIGNKTEAHLKSFFSHYRRKYNLDAVLKEYENENGPYIVKDDNKEEKVKDNKILDYFCKNSCNYPLFYSKVSLFIIFLILLLSKIFLFIHNIKQIIIYIYCRWK